MPIRFSAVLLCAALALPAAAQAPEVDFGDDGSQWARDGECDDPRFEGGGMHGILLAEDLGHDATDCRRLFEAGTIRLRADAMPPEPGLCDSIDFGDDRSEWSGDGECDDPRFEGLAMSEALFDGNRGHDASDCRRACDLGAVRPLDARRVTDDGGKPATGDAGTNTPVAPPSRRNRLGRAVKG